MTTKQIKEKLNDYKNKNVTIKYNLGRNKFERYNVVIKEIYDYVFLVELNETKIVKSFSYSDIITKTIKIDY